MHLSINLPNKYISVLQSGRLETKDNYLRTTAIHYTATTAGLASARK